MGLISLIAIVLKLRPNRLATSHVNGDSLDTHSVCNDFSAPAATSLYASLAVPRLVERCPDISLPLVDDFRVWVRRQLQAKSARASWTNLGANCLDLDLWQKVCPRTPTCSLQAPNHCFACCYGRRLTLTFNRIFDHEAVDLDKESMVCHSSSRAYARHQFVDMWRLQRICTKSSALPKMLMRRASRRPSLWSAWEKH